MVGACHLAQLITFQYDSTICTFFKHVSALFSRNFYLNRIFINRKRLVLYVLTIKKRLRIRLNLIDFFVFLLVHCSDWSDNLSDSNIIVFHKERTTF